MSLTDSIAGDWRGLVDRLASSGALTRWALREPALGALGDVAGLPLLLTVGCDPVRADELIGALVRLGAADGGDEPDAVLVLLHLLDDGVRRIVRRFADLGGDIGDIVIGALTIQIRSFPWRRRTRAYAANLLLDTQSAVWREVGPNRSSRGSADAPLLVDPTLAVDSALDRWVPGPGDDGVDLVDVLRWAQRTGVADRADVELLVELEYAREFGHGPARVRVARAHGIDERTVRRRRMRVLNALRGAVPAYLAA